MDTMFLHAHRGFAYLILIVVAVFMIALFSVLIGYSGKITNALRKSTMVTMILFHIQFLIGLGMLFVYSGYMDVVKAQGMGHIMKNAALRFSYIEHPFSMLLAAVLMTIVNKQMKSNSTLNFKIMFLAFVAVVLFFYAMPFSRLFGS